MKTQRGFYVKLAERAHKVALTAARKANGGAGYNTTWPNLDPASRKGFVALVNFIAKELRKEP
jgi:hypothetical protein